MAHLLIPVHEVHGALMMVVVMWAFGGIDGDHEIVGTQAVALCVWV